MLQRFPAIAYYLVRFERNSVFVFPSADMAIEAALFDPLRFEKRDLPADSGHDDICIPRCLFIVGIAADDVHVFDVAGQRCL